MKRRSPEVDAIHAALPPSIRKSLESIRRAVHAAAPGAEEFLTYGMPAVRYEGKPLVAWRAAAKHCAFHPLSGQTVAACAELLGGFQTSPGTVRFSPDHPLPAAIVARMVELRIAENRALDAAKSGKPLARKRTTAVAKRAPPTKAAARRPAAPGQRAAAPKRRTP